MDMIKTFVLLAIFLILAAGNIANIIRHHKEKKQAIAEGKIEKKKKRSFFSKKKKGERGSYSYHNEDTWECEGNEEDSNV